MSSKPKFPEIILSVKKMDEEENQLIYCSQLYGTFFAVSAKLKLTANKKNLESMDISLINYKGLYNIGILDITRTSWKYNNGKAELVLHLRANYGLHGFGRNLTIDCKNTPLIDLEQLTVSRHLHRIFPKPHPHGHIKDHLYEDFFDNEFYRRDGYAIGERPIRIPNEIEEENNEANKEKFDFTGVKTTDGGRCETTVSRFV